MRKLKILFVSYSFPPAQSPAAQRVFSIVKYINKMRFQPFVLTPKIADSSLGYSKTDISLEPSVKLLRVGRGVLGNSEKIRAELRSDKLSYKGILYSIIYKYLLFPDKGMFWLISLMKQANKIISLIKNLEPDLIFSTSPLFTNHIIAFLLHKKLRVPMVADFRDLHYIGNISESRLPFYLKKLHSYWEEKILRASSAVIFISDSMKEFYVDNYPYIMDKAFTVYNGFDLSEFSELQDEIPSDKKIKIFYAGSFYGGTRNPFPFLSALDQLYREGKLPDLEIAIAGRLENNLLNQIKKLKIAKFINFLGIIERKQALRYMKKSHFLWLIVSSKKSHEIGIPLKTFEYILARRFILAFAPENSEVSNLIRNFHLGEVFPNELSGKNIDLISHKLLKIFDKFKDIYCTKPNFKIMERFNRKYQVRQVEEIIENVFANRKV